MIALTETATTKVKELIAAEGQPEIYLRVAVRPGGCSGLSYEMFFDTEKTADDIVESYGDVDADLERGESLLNVLRERLGVVSAKDGCAPQGQCGCCTVLVDGEPRVACVTPVARIEGRAVTTIEGLDESVRVSAASAFVASGGSQCGFCTPGIVMRFAGERARDVD